MFNPVLVAYQYYKLVDLLIKKERSQIGQSLHVVPWFPQSREEEKEEVNEKDEGMNIGKESKGAVQKEEMKIDFKDENYNAK